MVERLINMYRTKIWISLFFIFVSLGCGQNHQAKKSSSVVIAEASNDDGSTQDHSSIDTTLIETESGGSFNPFYIYSEKGSRENHYVPSGLMPDGKCISFDDKWSTGCQSGETCIQIAFEVECARNNQSWAGIYWLNPSNNWGKRKGGFNLTGAR